VLHVFALHSQYVGRATARFPVVAEEATDLQRFFQRALSFALRSGDVPPRPASEEAGAGEPNVGQASLNAE
jgi:hypothetical protein